VTDSAALESPASSPTPGVAVPARTPAALVAEVVFPLPVHRTFDYTVPSSLGARLRIGDRVSAPFGRRGGQVGVVVRLRSEPSAGSPAALKSIEQALDPAPVLTEKELDLARWMASRYFCSLGQAVFAVIPVGKQLAPKRFPASAAARARTEPAPRFDLTVEQVRACDRILPAVREDRAAAFLLWGVAAAGKTETYLRAAEVALAAGKSVLYLVPEIGLTPQVEALLRARFGETVEVWHSEIARSDRWRVWRRVLDGGCRVLLGPRSAVFAPLRRLGLVVVDEEHDPSYKEDSGVRYHARDVAREKARLHGAVVVLGTATPSMESYSHAKAGTLELIEMGRRVHEGPPPVIRLVDMRRSGSLLSEPLAKAAAERLERHEQTILFLNRRGFATYVSCPDCGWEARCPDCLVSLVYHKADRRAEAELLPPEDAAEGMRCHYCSHRAPRPERCPQCKGDGVRMRGRGTQKTESELALWFPGARVLRWDRDSTRRRGAHGRAFEAVRSDSVDIVVGTQMIAQGLDFPNVTLVGVIDADRTLRFPDFRAGERTFQLLTQVAGRAGRADRPGEVFFQTRHPDHYAVRAAQALDYLSFAEEELRFRQEMDYPPFVRMAQLLLRGKDAGKVERAADDLMRWMEAPPLPPGTTCLGPAPAFHALRGGKTQWHVVVKGTDAGLAEALRRLREYKPCSGVTLAVDVDPEELH
jgi:primosomal protein N' (replication factor Y)